MTTDRTTSTLDALLRQFSPGRETCFEVLEEADGKRLSVLLKEVPSDRAEPPRKLETQAEAATFESVDSLLTFLGRYGSAHTAVWISCADGKVYGVLDMEAEDGREQVLCSPLLFPQWAEWDAMIGRAVDLEDFILLLRETRRIIDLPGGHKASVAPMPVQKPPSADDDDGDDGDDEVDVPLDFGMLVALLSQVKVAKTIEADIGEGADSLNRLEIRTVVKGGPTGASSGATLLPIPTEIPFRTPIWLDEDELHFQVDITIKLVPQGEDKPPKVQFVPCSGDAAAARAAAFLAMRDRINEKLGPVLKTRHEESHLVVMFGKPGLRDWRYLDTLPGSSRQ